LRNNQLNSKYGHSKAIFSLNLESKIKMISGRNFTILIFLIGLFSVSEMFVVTYADSLHEDFLEDISEEFLMISDTKIILSGVSSSHVIEIKGKIDSFQFGHPVEIIISGNGIEKTYQTYRIDDGTFQTFFMIDSEWSSGTYDVQVNFLDETKFVQSINIENQNPGHVNEHEVFLKQFESTDVKEKPKSFLEISESKVILSDELSRQTVEVYGKIISNQFGVPVEIIISGNGIEKKWYAPRINDDTFQTFFEIDSEWDSGVYDVYVNYFNERIFTETINVTNVSSQSQQIIEQVEEQNTTNEIQTMEFEIKQVYDLQLNSHDSDVSMLSNGVAKYTKINMTDFVLMGTIPNNIAEQLLIIKIQKDGKTIEKLYVSTNNNNEFFVPISMKKSWTDGLYTAKIFVGELEIDSQGFLMQQNNFEGSKIPGVELIDRLLSDLEWIVVDEPLEQIPSVSILEISEILEGEDLPIQIISGMVDNYSQHRIDIDISHNSIIIESLSVYGTDEGVFSVPIQIEEKWESGDYDVIAYDMNNLIGQTQFILE
jgi:hypothetical protein